MLPLTSNYLEFCFSHSLEQITMSPIKTTDRTALLIDHELTNSFHQVNQSGVLDLGLSDHGLIFSKRKTLKPKRYKCNEIFIRSLKH